MLCYTIPRYFKQYQQGLNFVISKASQELKDIHLTIPNKAPSFTPYTKADVYTDR